MTFLIAYLTMLLVSDLPLFFLELALGQYAGKGPLKVFGRMAPIAKGLGYGMLFISFLVVIYYNLIIAWTIYYTFAGFTSELPWTYCGEGANATLTSQDCYHKIQEETCFNASNVDTFWNRGCSSVDEVCRQFNFTVSDEREYRNITMEDGDKMEVPWVLKCMNETGSYKLNSVRKALRLSKIKSDLFCCLGLQESVA